MTAESVFLSVAEQEPAEVGIGVWELVRDGEVVADVVRFSDDETVTKWRGKYRSLTRWETFGDAAAIHTHFGADEGRTRFRLRCLIREDADV